MEAVACFDRFVEGINMKYVNGTRPEEPKSGEIKKKSRQTEQQRREKICDKILSEK